MKIIIFVHGMNADASSWNGVEKAVALKTLTKTEAVTLPGHETRMFDGDLTDLDKNCGEFLARFLIPANSNADMDAYVAAIVAAFPENPDDDDLPDVALVGHSMGGAVISVVAAAYPKRIDRLIYVAAMFPSKDKSINDLRRDIAREGPVKINALCVEFASVGEAAKQLVYQPELPKKEPFNPTPAYTPIPKHYIGCDDDEIIPPKAQTYMLKGHDLASHQRLPTGHLPQFQAPEELLDRILTALDA